MVKSTRRLSYILVLSLCIPLHMNAFNWHIPHTWYNPHSWVATGKTFVSRTVKSISHVISNRLTYIKTNPKKTGLVVSAGTALAAVCWFGWKKIVGLRAATEQHARVPEVIEMQPLNQPQPPDEQEELRSQLAERQHQLDEMQERLRQAELQVTGTREALATGRQQNLQELRRQNEQKDAELANIRQALDGMTTAREQLLAENSELVHRQDELSALKPEIARLHDDRAEKEKTIQELSARTAALQGEHAGLQKEFERLRQISYIRPAMVDQETQTAPSERSAVQTDDDQFDCQWMQQEGQNETKMTQAAVDAVQKVLKTKDQRPDKDAPATSAFAAAAAAVEPPQERSVLSSLYSQPEKVFTALGLERSTRRAFNSVQPIYARTLQAAEKACEGGQASDQLLELWQMARFLASKIAWDNFCNYAQHQTAGQMGGNLEGSQAAQRAPSTGLSATDSENVWTRRMQATPRSQSH